MSEDYDDCCVSSEPLEYEICPKCGSERLAHSGDEYPSKEDVGPSWDPDDICPNHYVCLDCDWHNWVSEWAKERADNLRQHAKYVVETLGEEAKYEICPNCGNMDLRHAHVENEYGQIEYSGAPFPQYWCEDCGWYDDSCASPEPTEYDSCPKCGSIHIAHNHVGEDGESEESDYLPAHYWCEECGWRWQAAGDNSEAQE